MPVCAASTEYHSTIGSAASPMGSQCLTVLVATITANQFSPPCALGLRHTRRDIVLKIFEFLLGSTIIAMFRCTAVRLVASVKAAAEPALHTLQVSKAQGISKGLTGGKWP